MWQEGHTVHATNDEAEKEVTDILELYKKTIEEELAVPVIQEKKVRRTNSLVQFTLIHLNH